MSPFQEVFAALTLAAGLAAIAVVAYKIIAKGK